MSTKRGAAKRGGQPDAGDKPGKPRRSGGAMFLPDRHDTVTLEQYNRGARVPVSFDHVGSYGWDRRSKGHSIVADRLS